MGGGSCPDSSPLSFIWLPGHLLLPQWWLSSQVTAPPQLEKGGVAISATRVKAESLIVCAGEGSPSSTFPQDGVSGVCICGGEEQEKWAAVCQLVEGTVVPTGS